MRVVDTARNEMKWSISYAPPCIVICRSSRLFIITIIMIFDGALNLMRHAKKQHLVDL